MPYFIFRIGPDRALTLLKTCVKYQEAKTTCRELRMKDAAENPTTIRMAFAASERDAKRLLSDRHEPSHPLEEWEG